MFFRFSDVFYVDASSATTMTVDLASIALEKGVGKSFRDALRWLESNRKDWLLLVDNADDPHLNLGDFLPRAMHGSIIITSRNAELRDYGPQSYCEISRMTLDDAKSLLLRRSGLHGQERLGRDNENIVAQIVEVRHLVNDQSRQSATNPDDCIHTGVGMPSTGDCPGCSLPRTPPTLHA